MFIYIYIYSSIYLFPSPGAGNVVLARVERDLHRQIHAHHALLEPVLVVRA